MRVKIIQIDRTQAHYILRFGIKRLPDMNEPCPYKPLQVRTGLRPAKQDFRGADCYFQLDQPLSEQLRSLAKAQQTTLYTVLLSGFYLTLATLSGQSDLGLGRGLVTSYSDNLK